MLPQGFIQDLLSRVDIVEVVGRQVELKKAGINHKGLCPFHGEKTPSFIVSPSRQTYHCFGCGAHGDAIRFLVEHGGLHFMDAVRDLAQSVGMAVPEDDRSPAERDRDAQLREHQATLSEVLAKAAAHWQVQLKGSERAKHYLKGRGLTGAVAKQFGLGYAPEGWRGLASVFARYDDPLLVETGLVILKAEEGQAEEDAKRYDRFRDRIMFPIRSVKGEVIGFGGRVLDSGEPKYLNSPETPVFVKGRELYGLFEARQALRARGYALVVEGYMDVVALAQNGYANAVATLGTACTADHVAKLFRFTDAVVFSFDGDAAGRRAAARALEAALPHASDTRSIRFLFLPPEHDPDSFIREHGPEAFEAQVAQALPLSRMLMQTAGEGCDLATPEGRARLLAQAGPLFQQMPHCMLREQILAELAQAGGLSAEQLSRTWQRSGERPHRGGAGAQGHGGHGGRTAPEHDEGPPPADDGTPWHETAAAQRRGSGKRWKRDGERSPFGAPRFAPRRLPGATTTLLDRAAWLLLSHCALWDQLGPAQHELMAGQPAPYGQFFGWIERCLHEHGPLARSGLLQHLHDGDEQREVDPGLAELVQRLQQLHDLGEDVNVQAELLAVLHRLQVQQVREELNLLIESGELSEAALARRNELLALQRSLALAPPG